MPVEPFQVLGAGSRPVPLVPRKPRLLVAGATGALGNEVLRRLVGLQHFESARVLAREPITAALRGVAISVVPEGEPAEWPLVDADVGVILFEPPRLFYDRERALWTPQPDQMLPLAQWLRRGGVQTLAVVLPHTQGRLPDALQRGLAGLDEQAVAAMGFTRLLIVRSAQKPAAPGPNGVLHDMARWLLSAFKYMVPASAQPVRAVKVAEFVALALQLAPPGIHVAAPETVWQAAQGDPLPVVAQWLAG